MGNTIKASKRFFSIGFNAKDSNSALDVSDRDVNRVVRVTNDDKSAVDNAGTNIPPITDFAHPPYFLERADDDVTVIQTDMSQYTVPNGRSACTCIALICAKHVLTATSSNSVAIRDVLTVSFLNQILLSGIELYNSANTHSNVEHLSPDEVLSNESAVFAPMKLKGAVRQGVLSSNQDNPLGLKSQLFECRSQEGNTKEWMAIVITKPPETVCVLLPPASPADEHYYTLIDSHPRPQLKTFGCYAMLHSSLEELVRSLEFIFPETDLGADVDETLAMMYNSFDVYALQI